MLIDHHCHLDHSDFSESRDEVIDRAHKAGIDLMVNISTRVRNVKSVFSIIDAYANVFGTIGTHPHYAHEELDISPDELVKLSKHPKIVGIGEAGLDYYYKYSSPSAQAQGFRSHISASRMTGLPLEIHTRDADTDTIRILEEEYTKGAFPAVLHCFTGGRELAHRAIDLGLYISFSGIITFKKSQELRDIAAEIPLDRILVETDAPYLAPEPYRGKRNEPSYIMLTAKILAELHKIAPEEFYKISANNFYRLFTKVSRPVNTQ